MKKMKGVVMESSPYAVYEDPKTRFKHQSLLQDFEELQKVVFICGFPWIWFYFVRFIRSDILFDFLVDFVRGLF